MLSSWAGGNVPGRVWSSSQLGRAGSEHPTGQASPARGPGAVPVRGSGCRITLCVSQESRSPAGDAPEPRRSAFEPAVSGQEKLDFNRNLKEGKEGVQVASGSPTPHSLWASRYFCKAVGWDGMKHPVVQSPGLCSPGCPLPLPALPTPVPAGAASDANHREVTVQRLEGAAAGSKHHRVQGSER